MAEFPVSGYRLMIVDDDAMTRAVLGLLAGQAGFVVEGFGSGAEALARLAEGGEMPHGILADMQMPGPSGETFVRLARAACGDGSGAEKMVVLAMSASPVAEEQLRWYDGFLRKPFGMDEMRAALDGAGRLIAAERAGAAVVLKLRTLAELAGAMTPERLRELYRLVLGDADARLLELRQAAAGGDEQRWRTTAHQLKGSFAMVGAEELAGLAAGLETGPFPVLGMESGFAEIVSAMGRLRRILEAELP